MDTNYQFKHLPFSTKLTIFTMGINTLLFLAHFIIPNYFPIVIFGYIYMKIIILINSITFCHLLYQVSKQTNKEDLIIRILLLLSNIPIAFLYAHIVINNH